ncbi:MAG TPA: hypothetical protein PKZ42_01695 [Syntrophales bacterium]|nr:hypothetical protein [Syntrophales bacterium]
MLTVSISINGNVIYTRSGINRLQKLGVYLCDDGSKIKHKREDGAVKLAIKALKTIKEVK